LPSSIEEIEMHDLIIRGGNIVDGTGAAPYSADIAICDGNIAEIGRVSGPAREEINAEGALVTPGFIDIHTHYDGQFLWDDELEPSFSNGVTTAIAGNCGVGFAPANDRFRSQLVELMEGVEDIPGIVLDEGLDWLWKSFPDYLDRLAERHFTMDVASLLPQAPLRVFVMGERALQHEQATPQDVARMQQLVREAMAAGALGVSGSRILEHLSSKGDHVPGTFAVEAELLALAEAMGQTGKGTFQMIPLGGGGNTMGTAASLDERLEEHARIERLAEISGRPVTYILHSYEHAPDEWRTLLECSERANARGLEVVPQVAARGLGILLGLDAFHIFLRRPSYIAIAHLPRAERAKAMRDPKLRQAILSEANQPVTQGSEVRAHVMAERFAKTLQRFYVLDATLDYEPDEDARLDRIAERTGRTMDEVLYDTITAGDGGQMVADFVLNYVGKGLDTVHDMLAHPQTVSGLGDGGAHLFMICDAAMPTFHLSFWGRDRKRGPKLPIEASVHKLTGKPAQLFGLNDRGTIACGTRADINVIDFDRVGNGMPEMVFDLPLGRGRFLQKGTGYLATIVAGTVTRRNDQATGARPGRLVRSA
jgi:N-acyl-D-aspartate/D-glutamate deacylase